MNWFIQNKKTLGNAFIKNDFHVIFKKIEVLIRYIINDGPINAIVFVDQSISESGGFYNLIAGGLIDKAHLVKDNKGICHIFGSACIIFRANRIG